VTIPGRTPTWAEIEQFCAIDGWTHVRSTDHEFWQKTLDSGEVLETHTSFGGNKTMSPGRFSSILRNQLRITKVEFWQALQSGKPVDRPTDVEEAPPSIPGWVLFGLKNQGLTDDEIATLGPEEAEKVLQQKWAEPK